MHLEEFEDRLKRFVFVADQTNTNTGESRKSLPAEEAYIKKKQLMIAFSGNQYLEKMMNDRQSLDWRILMRDDIFVVL